MIIILEGPDNAGKTSLAKHLEQHSRAGYFHPGGRPVNWDTESACLYEQLSIAIGCGSVIIDRATCISQTIYSPNTDFDLLRATFRQAMLDHCVLIYCRPSNERLMDVGNFTWRAEETEEHRQEIILNAHTFIERYDTLMQTIPCISYDFADMYAPAIRAKAVAALSGSSSDEQWFHNVVKMREW